MIFVTVGTHEQPFNRLVEYMDKWAERQNEKVVIQTGFSTYIPEHCKYRALFSYPDMIKLVDKARIVITHGGPSSFFMPLQIGKIPIVVPRKVEFHEHVNNHQVDFCKQVAQRQKNIIVVEDIDGLGDVIDEYDQTVERMANSMTSNNAEFCRKFEEMVWQLLE